MSVITRKCMESIWTTPNLMTLEEAMCKVNGGSVVANLYFLNEYFFKEDEQLKLEYSDKSNKFDLVKLPYRNDSQKNGWIEIEK